MTRPDPPFDGALPDPRRCAVEPMSGVRDIAICRVEGSYHCQHLLHFGDLAFCRHPERERFVVRALKRA